MHHLKSGGAGSFLVKLIGVRQWGSGGGYGCLGEVPFDQRPKDEKEQVLKKLGCTWRGGPKSWLLTEQHLPSFCAACHHSLAYGAGISGPVPIFQTRDPGWMSQAPKEADLGHLTTLSWCPWGAWRARWSVNCLLSFSQSTNISQGPTMA